jgi:hypothetical protein
MTEFCKCCRVDLSQYPLARDGFCVPSHATNDNRLEMEPGMYEVQWLPCASPRRSDVAGADLLCDRPRGHAGNHAVGMGTDAFEWPAPPPLPPDVYGGTL